MTELSEMLDVDRMRVRVRRRDRLGDTDGGVVVVRVVLEEGVHGGDE